MLRFPKVEIEMSVAKALRDKARQHGVSTGDLATELIRRQLAAA